MRLFDQEHARTGLQLFLDQGKLPLREPKVARVLLEICIRIRKKYLGGRLLYEGSADGAVQHVARTLRRQAHHGSEFPPGLRTILGETLERLICEQAPKFVHPAYELTAIEELPH